MNNGLEGIKKEAVIAVSKHCPSIYMVELRKTTKNLSQGGQYLNQDSNRATAK